MEIEDKAPLSRGYAWFVLFIMFLLYLVNVADRYVASGLLEDIKQSFAVSDTVMGLLVGPAFAIFYMTFAIPIARLADKGGRVKIIAAGAIVWSGFSIVSGLAQTPTMFAIARLGVGVGEAAFIAPAISLLSDYFPPKKRTLAFALLNFGVYFGQVLGLVGGAHIAEAFDWRTAFIVFGVPGIVFGLLALFFVAEPLRGRLDAGFSDKPFSPGVEKKAKEDISFLRVVRLLWAKKSYRYLILASGFGGFASFGFGLWAPTLFARAFDLGITEANERYGVPSFIAGLGGALIVGVLADRLAVRHAHWPYRLSSIGLIGFFVSMTILCFTDNIIIATALTFPAGLMAGGWVISLQGALQDLLPAKVRATATSIWGFTLTLFGLVFGVSFVGFMSDYWAPIWSDQSIRYAMAAVLLANIPAIIWIWLAGNYSEKDRLAFQRDMGQRG